ncbi:MAG: S1 RNA-binding domain-containing protein [Candidatus Wolfebacteria bacterium]|nr:S1 RNA-binding domain-containing protein [Candidatus Wolfebacteria bacterium]
MIITTKKTISPMANLIKSETDLISFLKPGDLAEAKLLKRTGRKVYFDLGKFGTGIVYGIELQNAKSLIRNFEMGQAVSAKVVDLDGEEGLVELSLAGAHRQKNWQEIKDARDTNEAITLKITGANSGGLIADMSGMKAFLPVSQLASNHYPRVQDADKSKILEELKKLVGEELKVKILDFNPRLNKLIISEKEAIGQNMKELVAAYKVGDLVDVIVSGVADFGAFVRFTDNPAIEGLIHISELDHKLIENPKEIVKVDEAIKAKIIDIKDGQVSLSLKALKENPWDKAGEKFKEGEEVSGKLYKFNPFGAYISLDNDFHGLLHVSEFGSIEEMKKQLEPDKKYQFTIESLRPEEKRIILKLKK